MYPWQEKVVCRDLDVVPVSIGSSSRHSNVSHASIYLQWNYLLPSSEDDCPIELSSNATVVRISYLFLMLHFQKITLMLRVAVATNACDAIPANQLAAQHPRMEDIAHDEDQGSRWCVISIAIDWDYARMLLASITNLQILWSQKSIGLSDHNARRLLKEQRSADQEKKPLVDWEQNARNCLFPTVTPSLTMNSYARKLIDSVD